MCHTDHANPCYPQDASVGRTATVQWARLEGELVAPDVTVLQTRGCYRQLSKKKSMMAIQVRAIPFPKNWTPDRSIWQRRTGACSLALIRSCGSGGSSKI